MEGKINQQNIFALRNFLGRKLQDEIAQILNFLNPRNCLKIIASPEMPQESFLDKQSTEAQDAFGNFLLPQEMELLSSGPEYYFILTLLNPTYPKGKQFPIFANHSNCSVKCISCKNVGIEGCAHENILYMMRLYRNFLLPVERAKSMHEYKIDKFDLI